MHLAACAVERHRKAAFGSDAAMRRPTQYQPSPTLPAELFLCLSIPNIEVVDAIFHKPGSPENLVLLFLASWRSF